jgi:hypothetical protein
MRTVEMQAQATITRDAVVQGEVFRYVTDEAKPGLRMATETPEGKDGLYSVRLSDGVLMHSKLGSKSASVWPVEVVDGAFVEGMVDDDLDF